MGVPTLIADQATFGGTSGGTANAHTITVGNVLTLSDIQGVLIKWIPSVANTSTATLAVSGTAATAIKKPGASGLAVLSGGELQIGQPAITMYDGTQHVLLSAVNDNVTVTSASLGNSAMSFGLPVNLQINATVSANALTIAVKGNNGSDPSATNPVLIPFRHSTIANGSPVIRSLQAALSLTIASGSTLGTVNSQMAHLWVIAFDNGGTVALGVFNALSGVNVAPINEAALQTSASGTSGGNSAQTYYASTSAITAQPIRIIGYVEIQEVTAGTWATGPTYVQLFGPGIKKPGDVVQNVRTTTGTSTTGTTVIPVDNTIPQITEGDEYMTTVIVPTSSANLLEIDSQALLSPSGTQQESAALFRDATSNALVAINTSGIATGSMICRLTHAVVAASVSSTTFRLRGGSSSTTTTFNGNGGTQIFGGVNNSFLQVKEIMA